MPAQIFIPGFSTTKPSKGVGTVWAVQSAISESILADLKQAKELTSLPCRENETSELECYGFRSREVTGAGADRNPQKTRAAGPSAFYFISILHDFFYLCHT
jgi:hypothetical protein